MAPQYRRERPRLVAREPARRAGEERLGRRALHAQHGEGVVGRQALLGAEARSDGSELFVNHDAHEAHAHGRAPRLRRAASFRGDDGAHVYAADGFDELIIGAESVEAA